MGYRHLGSEGRRAGRPTGDVATSARAHGEQRCDNAERCDRCRLFAGWTLGSGRYRGWHGLPLGCLNDGVGRTTHHGWRPRLRHHLFARFRHTCGQLRRSQRAGHEVGHGRCLGHRRPLRALPSLGRRPIWDPLRGRLQPGRHAVGDRWWHRRGALLGRGDRASDRAADHRRSWLGGVARIRPDRHHDRQHRYRWERAYPGRCWARPAWHLATHRRRPGLTVDMVAGRGTALHRHRHRPGLRLGLRGRRRWRHMPAPWLGAR